VNVDTLNTLLSVPAVVAIVQLAKSFGVTGKWALLLAIAVAVAINVAAYYWSTSGAFNAVVSGLLLGLSAAGLYDVAKTASPSE
jgi:L-lactate permease